MGQGFILQAASAWGEAMEAFDRVFELIGDGDEEIMTMKATVAVLRGLRAREESAWCLCQLGSHEEASRGLETVLEKLDAASVGNEHKGDPQDRARCLWKIGKCLLASESESEYLGLICD
jgi:superkiller protein 3